MAQGKSSTTHLGAPRASVSVNGRFKAILFQVGYQVGFYHLALNQETPRVPFVVARVGCTQPLCHYYMIGEFGQQHTEEETPNWETFQSLSSVI